MVIGAITSGIDAAHGAGAWPIIVTWIALVFINLAIFRTGRRSPD